MNHLSINPKFAWGARLGYAARGSIYLIIGALALLAAFDKGGETTGSKGALQALLDEPFGYLMISIIIIGLLCYSAWRAIQSIKDTDQHGTDIKGIAIRAALLTSAVIHIGLAIWAITLLTGSASEASDSGQASGLLGQTWGRWVLLVVGGCIMGAGIAHLIKGWKKGFDKYMDIPSQHRPWAIPLCRFGLISRGFVYCIIGFFFLSSAWAAQNDEIGGVAEALSWLQSQPFGTWLLAITAVGLFAFGIYSALEAIYRRIGEA